ncbi:ABC transporter ATP-binding protein [Gordonia sp. NPDC058843]|uniref:ABC transporter ATP-binding protein n=1 Tax=Gordonia sp. NPDC058843 TaxID=3346648 RepID=UPI00367FA739
MLLVRGLQVRRGGSDILRDIDFHAHSGRIHVVLGASGSGKSTLLRSLVGLVPTPSRTRADLMQLRVPAGDFDLTSSRRLADVRGVHIGLVGQDPALDLTPLRRVASIVRETTAGHAEVADVLERCGLPSGRDIERKYCFQLSGGMAQRLALGLATARGPELLLADEPSTALDAISRARLAEHLRAAADEGSAVVLVTHDVGLARLLADDVTVLADGEIVETGPARRVLDEPVAEATRLLVRPRAPRARPRPARAPVRLDALDVTGLHAGWDGHAVLRDLSLRIGAGEVVGLAGRSGAGKSTLVACLTGLLAPDGGTIRIGGLDSATTSWRRLRREVQLVPQDPRGSLNPWRPIADQIRDPLDVHRVGRRAERSARVDELLDRVGLSGHGGRRPGALSTGQCQRAAIARALALRPRLLIADEPVTALDTALRADILELFAEIIAGDQMSALIISHDLHVLEYLGDRVAVLDDGHIIEDLAAQSIRVDARAPLTAELLAALPPLVGNDSPEVVRAR